MAKNTDRRGLGRGLSALMADADMTAQTDPQTPQRPDRELPIDAIRPNPDQPRRQFDPNALEDLAASISEKGILQPLIVRPNAHETGTYQIVAGERRWRAAQMVPLHAVPVLIREFTDTEVLEVAIIENIQRTDLNPIEEALGYRQLMDRFGHTQEHLSQAMGKSRSHLANLMRLLVLPDEVQEMVVNGQLSAGHARALITAPDPLGLARLAISKGMSVRDIERAAKSEKGPANKTQKRAKQTKDADTRQIEADLSAALGMQVVIDHDTQSGRGRITIGYKDLAQLDDLMRLFNMA